MSEVTMKSTKQQIFDAYQEALNKIKEKKALVEDPKEIMKKEAAENAAANADKIVSSGILNEELCQQYNDLTTAIENKKQELNTLYDISAEADSMLALINAHNMKTHELQDAYDTKKKELEELYAQRKQEIEKKHQEYLTTLKDERAVAEKDFQKAKAELEASVLEQKTLSEKNRKREQEEYTYKLNRERSLENDKWEDEKVLREKEIAEKEALTEKLLLEAEAKVEYIAELEAKVAAFPQEMADAISTAENKGKKEAGKEYGYEKAMYMKEKEYELKAVNDALTRAESALADANKKIAELTNKLDDSYTRMQELASTTVKSNGGVKILDRESTSNK